jgi:hypothetical protein
VSSSWPLDAAGRWRGWIEVTQGGKASLAGDEQAFGFWVRLPRDQVLQRWRQRTEALTSPF